MISLRFDTFKKDYSSKQYRDICKHVLRTNKDANVKELDGKHGVQCIYLLLEVEWAHTEKKSIMNNLICWYCLGILPRALCCFFILET